LCDLQHLSFIHLSYIEGEAYNARVLGWHRYS
jgi:hypothetical protein